MIFSVFAAWVLLSAVQGSQDSYKVIAEGKMQLPTAPVAPLTSRESGGCATMSVKAPGVRKGDEIFSVPESDISKIRGYASLRIRAWAEDDKAVFAVCNPSKYPILPGRVTLLWQALRLE